MQAPSDPLLWITLAVIFVGLVGSILPGLPGVPLIFLSALVYGFVTGFEYVGGWVLALLGLLAVLALVADFVATSYGARRFGASWAGTLGGLVGGIIGTLIGAAFVIGAFFGLILGTIGGIFVGEYLLRHRRGASDTGESSTRDWRRASRAAGGVLVGYVLSAVIQGVFGLASVIVFVIALFY